MIREQMRKIIQSAVIKLTGFSFTGTGAVITPEITAALTAATLPNAVSTSESVVGLICSGGSNKVYMKEPNGDFITDAQGNRVYARLIQNGAAYELEFFSHDGTSENVFTFAASTSVDIVIPYRFPFSQFPVDALLLVKEFGVGDNATTTDVYGVSEVLTVVTQNTLPDLAQTPSGPVTLIVENLTYHELLGHISRTGQILSWNPAAAGTGFNIEPGYEVVALYNI